MTHKLHIGNCLDVLPTCTESMYGVVGGLVGCIIANPNITKYLPIYGRITRNRYISALLNTYIKSKYIYKCQVEKQKYPELPQLGSIGYNKYMADVHLMSGISPIRPL